MKYKIVSPRAGITYFLTEPCTVAVDKGTIIVDGVDTCLRATREFSHTAIIPAGSSWRVEGASEITIIRHGKGPETWTELR